MKFLAKIVIFSLCIANLHGELLIIKRVQPDAVTDPSSSSRVIQPSIVPLDASDEPNYPAIAQILLNYQWPMVIDNQNLTLTEKDGLLTPGIENAEEKFIRHKLQAINPAYDVAFIPTCVYEMFIIDIARKENVNPLNTVLNKINRIVMINPINEINGYGPTQKPSQDVHNFFNFTNTIFYKDAFFYCNNVIVEKLLSQYSVIKYSFDGIEMNNWILGNLDNIINDLLFNIYKNKEYNGFIIRKIRMPHLDPFNTIPEYHKATIHKKTIVQYAELEYKMKESNQGLLVRSSNEVNLKRSDSDSLVIMGSTLGETQLFQTIQPAYKNQSNFPYSISFGNSLFAGFFNDLSACVIYYFETTPNNGYGLSIDKKMYIENQADSLFFISSLATIPALFASGEYFHSRTKACFTKKTMLQEEKIKGLHVAPLDLNDPEHIMTTFNDPLVNAENFSNYLAKNMHSLDVGIKIHGSLHLAEQKSQMTKENSESFLKENQEKAADYYKAIRILKKKLPVATKNHRKNLDKKYIDEKFMDDTTKYINLLTYS